MKYHTKLYLGIGCLVIGGVLSIETINYIQARQQFFQDLQSNVLSIASTGAALIDKQEVAAASKDMSEQTASYQEVILQLREIRDVNRRKATYVNYIYLLKPDPREPTKAFVVVADATQDKSFFSPPGTLYPEGVKFGVLSHINEPFSPGIIHDRWGKFLTAYAPVYGPDGNYVATLGVNITYASVEKGLTHIKWTALAIFLIFLTIGIFVAAFLARKITNSLSKVYAGITKIEEGEAPKKVSGSRHDEFANLEYAIHTKVQGIEEKEQKKINLRRYLSKSTMERLLESGKDFILTGDLTKITLLFTDIRDFSLLTDKLSPREALSILNEYFTKMLEVLMENGATFDKFIGDGLMALFGAPLKIPYDEDVAIETALKMQEALKELNEKWKNEGRPQLKMSIGIHTGEVIVGNMGAERRLEYSAIGSNVRIGARLVEVALQLDVPVLVSGDTWDRAHQPFKSTELSPLHIKGRTDPIKIYSIEKKSQKTNPKIKK